MSEHSLLERLKRARAAQVAVVYLGACWFVLQIVDTLQDMLSLPAWIGPVTVVLLGVGFVVVLATAWVQSLAATTAAEEAGEIPTDWEIAPGDALESLKAGRIPHLTWARAILGGVVAISLAIGAAGAYVLVRGSGLGPTPVGAERSRQGVAVLPFTVNGPGLDEFAEGMVSLVSMNIDGVDGIRSINPRTIMAEWDAPGDGAAPSLDDALRVAGATGARYAVVGDAVSTGRTVRFSAELYDVADGSSLGRGVTEGPIENVLPLIDEMSVGLLRRLAARSGRQSTTGIQRLEGLVTSSVPALSAYLEGEAHYRVGRQEQALEAYERAVQADSTFSLAWSRIASVYGWIEPGSPQIGEARDKALAFVERLPAREATLIRAYGDVTRGRPTPGVLDDLRRHVDRFPDDPEGWAVLGEYYGHVAGVAHTREDFGEAVLRAIDLDPNFAPYYVHGLRYLVGAGDWRFFEYMELYRGLVDEQRATRYQMQWDFFWGRDEALAVADSFYRANPISAVNTGIEVLLASDSITERNLALARMIPSLPFGPSAETQVLGQTGRFDELVAHSEPFHRLLSALARGLSAVLANATVDGVDARRGAALVGEAIAAVVDGFADGSLDAEQARSDFEGLARAMRQLAEGDAAGARATLESSTARGGGFGLPSPWTPLYAEALARTGDPEGAIRYYQAALVPWRGIARLRLGELHEATGDAEQARENYRGFLRLFAEADDGGAALVARGRAGLARVGG